MKKIYNQPEVQMLELTPMNIICVSITDGGGTDGKGDLIGD